MHGKLFARDFLEVGITETPAWASLRSDDLERTRLQLAARLARMSAAAHPNEALTERQVIVPTLEAIGWPGIMPQQTVSRTRRLDVPDLLLFLSAKDHEAALGATSEPDRYRFGTTIAESKRWERALDRSTRDASERDGTPSTQILRYLSLTDVQSNGKIKWGILTNGRLWRLYWQGARSRSEDFLEIDLGACVGLPATAGDGRAESGDPQRWFKVFTLLFGVVGFSAAPDDAEGRTLLDLAHAESVHWEAQVSGELGGVVLGEVYPALVSALIARDPQRPVTLSADYLEEARRAALILLYRLLFVLYAEDRHLLPTTDARYADYSLHATREDIARRLDVGEALSARACSCFDRFTDLCRIINEGDPSVGLPAYDGGLFDPGATPLLGRVRLADATFSPLVDKLSRRSEGGSRRWINYRDLSVQHLGSVYEKLLEFDLAADKDHVLVRPNAYARRVTGSYYTHDDLVKLIISRALEPHSTEVKEAFRKRLAELVRGGRLSRPALAKLRELDPASRLLSLAICDPAMGSGHFLVALVDHLADEVLQAMAEAESETRAAGSATYRSPLLDRFERTRQQILARSEEQGLAIDFAQLDDRHLVRRMVLKRCVYGVDKNPMAVELAKVALWLHTFTVGAPLSFLDHHLRTGDSLFGEWVADIARDLSGATSFTGALAAVDSAGDLFEAVAQHEDADIADVEDSKVLFGQGQAHIEPLRRLFDFWHAARWLKAREGHEDPGVTFLLRGFFGEISHLLATGDLGELQRAADGSVAQARHALAVTRGLAESENFFHWELAFPTVWRKRGPRQRPGFDVVIGNPPWDRMKLQEVEWFAARRREIAAAQRASDRKKMIAALRKTGDALWHEYEAARQGCEDATRVARDCGQYPLLSGGDVNLYSLFVERASRLVNDTGTVGLLTPSGIAADATAAPFFREIATTGRLASLLDFENKKVFFPDIHASFKFSVLVFGGRVRTFEGAECGFFLHDIAEVRNPDRVFRLGPDVFSAVNPNTGTAPVFRTRRDADITIAIYGRLPVLVDRRGSGLPRQAWPVRYSTMFHMTNDSGLFKTSSELEAEGFYPLAGNVWRRGKEEYLPLIVGKCIHQYDHRAADVGVNPESLHVQAYSEAIAPHEKKDPNRFVRPQFWVPATRVAIPGHLRWTIGFRDIARPTDERTVIAAVVPAYGLGNTLPALLPEPPTTAAEYGMWSTLLLANMNSFVFDYVARQKVQATHLNLYILEQLPVIPAKRFNDRIGAQTIGQFVSEQVLRLSFTASDIGPFARDLGYAGDPFTWDEEDRRHRMARLDALFFHLYGIDRTDADYILNQFPIVRAEDEQQFGRFLTRDLILAYMNATAAGDLKSIVKVT